MRLPDRERLAAALAAAPVSPRIAAALGALVSLLVWKVGMATPGPGLDASWNAGLAMATEHGLQFGREVVFTYGPLGFLQGPFVWYSGLGALAFAFSAAVYVAFCVALVWALGRTLPPLAAALVAAAMLALLPAPEQPLLIAAIAALTLLGGEWEERALWAFAALAASFAAVEALAKLSTGPVLAVVFLLALVGARARRAQLGLFAALLVGELALLWALSGQSFAALPDFAAHTWEVVSGYSGAMVREVDVPAWKVTMATIAAAAITVATVAACARCRLPDRRARWAAALALAVAGFTVFKEGVVRTDAGHLSLYFSTAAVLWLAVPWPRSRWWLMLGGAAAIVALGWPVRPAGMATSLDPVANLRLAVEGVRNLASPGRRQDLIERGRAGMKAVYRLDPAMRAQLRGRTVAVEPWEIGAVWAYRLDWAPLPVFQNYSAYTPALDRLNAAAVASPEGPERILRENAPLVWREFPTPDLDDRYPGWDPPRQQRAVLCHFAPLRTTARWQLLGRVPDRCGPLRPLGAVEARSGAAVPVPAPRPGEVVFARIEGAGIGGLERLTTLLLHARSRQLRLNGGRSYRLVPETAADGLLLRGRGEFVEAGPFATIPQARSVAVTGIDAELRYEFFAMPVAG